MPDFTERLRKGWNAFFGHDQTYPRDGIGFSYRPDKTVYRTYSARSILAAIYNRIAADFSSLEFMHVQLNENGDFSDIIKDSLNEVLTLSPNMDQSARAFFLDAAMTMFSEGVVALAPIDTDVDPRFTDSYKIRSLRVAKILTWYKNSVELECYNELSGNKERLVMLKRNVVIVENPFYAIMNEPNSLLQRLVRLLNQIDRTNEQNSSGKLDLILQLPYAIRGPARKREAEDRRKDIESQLTNAQLGIAYVDGTEKITQLNRAVENNLWSQAKDLEDQLYNQLGLTKTIFDGTADESTMLNYNTRTIEVIASAFSQEMERKWLSKTARTQRQAIRFYRDPFKLVPVGQIAEIADKFTRNEILTSNEIRSIVGRKPSKDPNADKLVNSNINHPEEEAKTESSQGQSISNLSTVSQATMDSKRIQNAKAWLNQIGNQSISKLEKSSNSSVDKNE